MKLFNLIVSLFKRNTINQITKADPPPLPPEKQQQKNDPDDDIDGDGVCGDVDLCPIDTNDECVAEAGNNDTNNDANDLVVETEVVETQDDTSTNEVESKSTSSNVAKEVEEKFGIKTHPNALHYKITKIKVPKEHRHFSRGGGNSVYIEGKEVQIPVFWRNGVSVKGLNTGGIILNCHYHGNVQENFGKMVKALIVVFEKEVDGGRTFTGLDVYIDDAFRQVEENETEESGTLMKIRAPKDGEDFFPIKWSVEAVVFTKQKPPRVNPIREHLRDVLKEFEVERVPNVLMFSEQTIVEVGPLYWDNVQFEYHGNWSRFSPGDNVVGVVAVSQTKEGQTMHIYPYKKYRKARFQVRIHDGRVLFDEVKVHQKDPQKTKVRKNRRPARGRNGSRQNPINLRSHPQSEKPESTTNPVINIEQALQEAAQDAVNKRSDGFSTCLGDRILNK
ncbi:MAG: hypothetical protein CL685_03610 [Candidatus Magasanikbacteria bacterium]|nr:hypothetical protein [Candidatus Magasanikbacteria bacterium]